MFSPWTFNGFAFHKVSSPKRVYFGIAHNPQADKIRLKMRTDAFNLDGKKHFHGSPYPHFNSAAVYLIL